MTTIQESVKTYEKDGIQFVKSNQRMKYNPAYHMNHGKPFTVRELAYLCYFYDQMRKADLALDLGRTHGTILSKAHELRQIGEFDQYKEMAPKLLFDA